MTKPAVQAPPLVSPLKTLKIGDTVLVRLDLEVWRPLIISWIGEAPIYDGQLSTKLLRTEYRVSGALICEPDDHTSHAFRHFFPLGDPGRITGRPDRHTPFAYAECLAEGDGVAHWKRRD